MNIRAGGKWTALVLIVGFALAGCGGPNEADVALLTGQEPETPAPPAPTRTRTPTAVPTPGQPAALRFVGAEPASIGVRGSGLPEQSTLTFQVTDAMGTPVGGIPVDFTFAQVADESISPTQDVTDTGGNAHVTLTSGQRASTVQITAQVGTVTPPLTVRSTAVAIVGGPPSQLHFSLAEQFLNISGRVTFGLTDQITAFVGDRFGNPVPAGTAVSFTAQGGTIGNPTATNALGQATWTLVSQEPIASNGIVTTLATTHGERPFVDQNADGVCEAGETLLKVAEPFYDANCNGVYDAGEDFIDLNGDEKHNDDQGSGTPSCGDQVVIFDTICTTFSGNTNVLLVPSETGPIPAGGSRSYTLTISDDVGNPIVGGSTVSISVGGRAKLLGPATFKIVDAQTLGQIVDGVNRFHFAVTDNAPTSQTSETDALIVSVTSEGLAAGGNVSVTVTDVITFLAAPMPTATPPPSPTPTTEPPQIAPGSATLPAGSGAPPSSCNGGTQTFVVTGGSPPFSVFGGGGCVSVTSVPASGGSFTFTAGNVVGSYAITVTDAVGRTASAGVTVEGPPTATPTETAPPTVTPTPTLVAAHIQLALFVNRASDNGDGTLSTVLSALVTDATGAAVADNVPVQFSLLVPTPSPVPAGVSVTSPGFTGQAAPCTLGFPVVPQPGDALSCVKYDTARQGQTVTIQAVVQTPSGPLTTTQVIVLPDLRTPTPTSTPTFTPSATPTRTPTPTPAAAHIQIALFIEAGCSNNDGTLTTVIDAVVSDAGGAAVPDNIPVNFSLVGPVPSGLAYTTPGLTGGPLPCVLTCFGVPAQPGDALSCIKYDAVLIGQTETIQASVMVPSGPPLTDTQTITLPPPLCLDCPTPTP